MGEENQVMKEPQQITKEPQQIMKEPERVTTKDPKKVEAGKRLAESNCEKREAKKREEQVKLEASGVNQYYGMGSRCHPGLAGPIGVIIALGVIGGLTSSWLSNVRQKDIKDDSTKCSNI